MTTMIKYIKICIKAIGITSFVTDPEFPPEMVNLVEDDSIFGAQGEPGKPSGSPL